MDLFFSMNGRIGRGKWWLGLIGLLIIAMGLFFLAPSIYANPVLSFIISLIFLYPACCLYLKRLQDRNKGHMPWLWIFILPGIVYNLMVALGIGVEYVEVIPGTPTPSPSGIGWFFYAAVIIVGFWGLIELGFLRGTRGDNDFGPDPVGE